MSSPNNYMQTLYCVKNVWPRENNATQYALVLKELIGFMYAIVLFFFFSVHILVVTDANLRTAVHYAASTRFSFGSNGDHMLMCISE